MPAYIAIAPQIFVDFILPSGRFSYPFESASQGIQELAEQIPAAASPGIPSAQRDGPAAGQVSFNDVNGMKSRTPEFQAKSLLF